MSEPVEKTLHQEVDSDGYRLSFDQVLVIYPILRHAGKHLADLLVCAVTAQELGVNNDPIGDEIPIVRINGITGTSSITSELPDRHLPTVATAVTTLKQKGGYRLGKNIEILTQPTLCTKCGMGCRISSKPQKKQDSENSNRKK